MKSIKENQLTNKTIYFLMILAMLSWGIAWTNAKLLNEYLNYYNLVFLRFLFGFLSILPFTLTKIKLIKNISNKSFINILSMGVLFFIYNYCFFKGTDLGKSGMGGVFVTTTNPLITLIIITIINKELKLNHLFGIVLGVIGGLVILDVFNLGISYLVDLKNIYFIFCSLIWGLMTVIMSYGQKEVDSLLYIMICYFCTTIISIFFISTNELFQLDIFNLKFLINFFLVSIGAMSFGTSVYIFSTPRLGPVKSSVFIFSVPFIAMSTAYFVLEEAITINVILGGLLSILAIYIVNKK